MKVDVQLDGRPEDAAARARELVALGADGLFTFEGAHDVFVPLIAPAWASTTTWALPAFSSAVSASAANNAWPGGKPPPSSSKRCPQPAEPSMTTSTARNANAEAKRLTEPISAGRLAVRRLERGA